MDDFTINDLGYVCGRVVYDDMDADPTPQIMRKNRVQEAHAHMDTLAREHIDWPFAVVANYDY